MASIIREYCDQNARSKIRKSLMRPESSVGSARRDQNKRSAFRKYLMTILFGTKLVALSAPAGQRPWTVADKLEREVLSETRRGSEVMLEALPGEVRRNSTVEQDQEIPYDAQRASRKARNKYSLTHFSWLITTEGDIRDILTNDNYN